MKQFKILVIVLVNILLCSFAFGRELWVKNGPLQREYYTVNKQQRGIVVKHYLQNQGEFQSLIKKYEFKDEASFKLYKEKNFTGFIASERLKTWQVEQASSLFGKKGQPIWVAKNQWSLDYEVKFANWIQTEVDTEFYKKYKIQTDCADALVGLRWIFARMNSLPVANTLADSDALFGNFSVVKKWAKLSTADKWYEDELFLAALNYVMDLTSTRTVINDGYPIKLDPMNILAGSYIITQSHDSGHARIISETHFSEVTELPIYTLASTTPRQVRSLVKEVFADQEWPLKNTKEILAFRWPIYNGDRWILKPAEEHPRYSREQFDLNLKDQYPQFILFIISRISDKLDPVTIVSKGKQEIIDYTSQRIAIVKNGFEYCSKNKCKEGSSEYDDWSTPSRDLKLVKKFADIDLLVANYEKLSPGLSDFWADQLRNTFIEIEGIKVNLSQLRYLFESGFTSINPNLNPAERWGLKASTVLTNWLLKIQVLLDERNAIISKDINCQNDCFPKTIKWVDLSTYHVDKELNRYFVEMRNYCSVVGEATCDSFLLSHNESLTYSGISKKLKEWIYAIPFFNSDARASLSAKWGMVSSNYSARLLPVFETIKVAANRWALLDGKKLIDLNSGNWIYQAAKDERILLTSLGDAFLVNDSNGKMHRIIKQDASIVFKDILDPENVLSENINRRVQLIDNEQFNIFRKVLKDSVVLFRINGNTLEFINEVPGSTMLFDSLVMMNSIGKLEFADLLRTKIYTIKNISSNDFKAINNLKIVSYNFPNVLLSYRENDWDVISFYTVNLLDSTIQKNELSIHDEFKIIFADKTKFKVLIQTNYNSEFPAIYGINFKKTVTYKLGNNFIDAMSIGSKIYVIQTVGSAWDNNLAKELIEWGDEPSRFNSYGMGEAQTFFDNYIYFNQARDASEEIHSKLWNPISKTEVLLPKLLMARESNFTIEVNAQNYISYHFDSGYGDYFGMGAVVSLLSSRQPQSYEIIPIFTLYSWLNRENLLDERWQKSFRASSVANGILISFGRNNCKWLGQGE